MTDRSGPEDPRARDADAARLRLELGRVDEALELATRGLATRPEDPELRSLVVLALLQAERHEEARARAASLIALEPEWAYPHELLARALLALGRPADAAGALDAARRLDAHDADLPALAGRAAYELDDHDGAVAHAREALRLDPDSADAHELLGDVAAVRFDPAEALTHVEAALRLDPEAAHLHHARARALGGLGRGAEARAAFATAAALAPEARLAADSLIRAACRRVVGRLSLLAAAQLAVGVALLVLPPWTPRGLGFVAGGLAVGAVARVRGVRRERRLPTAQARAVARVPGWRGRVVAAFGDPTLLILVPPAPLVAVLGTAALVPCARAVARGADPGAWAQAAGVVGLGLLLLTVVKARFERRGGADALLAARR